MKIVIVGEPIEQVKESCYIGSLISDDACQMPQRNQEKDNNGKISLFQEERTTKRRI